MLTYSQITAKIRRNTHSNSAVYSDANMCVDINLALNEMFWAALSAGGKWQVDDVNQTDYPIILTNLNSGQRDYTFLKDENNNYILQIYKVYVKNQSGIYEEIFPIDINSDDDTASITDGQEKEGVPYRYDKLANGFFLDPVPSYDAANGIKVYVSREPSFFLVSDTTKVAGFAGLFHEYLVLKPSYDFSRENSLDNKETLKRDLLEVKNNLIEYYSSREKDTINKFKMAPISFR